MCLSEALPALLGQWAELDGKPLVTELQLEMTKMKSVTHTAQDQRFVIRIAYHSEDNTALVLGPVKQIVEAIGSHVASEDTFVAPHWKFGPHVDIVVRTDHETMYEKIWPVAAPIIREWLEQHPDQTEIDPTAYNALSQKLGITELESGPFLPLYANNSFFIAPYIENEALMITPVADSKALFLGRAFPHAMRLLEIKRERGGDFFFVMLVTMLAMIGRTFRLGGLARGYISFRSHADFFFAAYDEGDSLRTRFNLLDQKLGGEIDKAISAVLQENSTPMPNDEDSLNSFLLEWDHIVRQTESRNFEVVQANAESLLGNNTHLDMAEQLRSQAPEDFVAQFEGRSVSEIGDMLLNTKQGQELQHVPEFVAYRMSVNFFYSMLPLIGVSPVQKFAICHLVANSMERLTGTTWKELFQAGHGSVSHG